MKKPYSNQTKKSMCYLAISFILDKNTAEALADILMENDALSVTFEDAANQALFQLAPSDTPLWNKTKVSALYPNTVKAKTIIALLQQQFPHTNFEWQSKIIEEQDWVRLTQQQFPPQQFANTLWVCPAWHDDSQLTGSIVRIDPGLAFGTGTHPTTALCLEWLAKHPPIDQNVIDYGCGSGILALSALALGAKQVYATDHDEQALIATHNNATLNNFINSYNLVINTPENLNTKPIPLVIANILANPLIQLSSTLNQLVEQNGLLILSGILHQETDAVLKAYSNFKLESRTQKDEWVRLVLKKISP